MEKDRTPGTLGAGSCAEGRETRRGCPQVLAPKETFWRPPVTIPGSGGGTKAALMSERWGAPPHPPIPITEHILDQARGWALGGEVAASAFGAVLLGALWPQG